MDDRFDRDEFSNTRYPRRAERKTVTFGSEKKQTPVEKQDFTDREIVNKELYR